MNGSGVMKRSALAAVAAAIVPLAAARAAPVTYQGTFDAANGSGVAGTTNLSLDGNILTVTVNATGLEANQPHEQHIHGFADGSQSNCPPSPLTPAIDTNGNGILEDMEAEAVAGPPILGLAGTNSSTNVDPAGSGVPGGSNVSEDPSVYPTVGADGALNYTGTFTVTPALFSDLTKRTVELHGMTTPGTTTFDATLPVACATLALTSDNGGGGGGGGGGGTAVPLPAGVWGGMYLLSGMGGTGFIRRRLRRT